MRRQGQKDRGHCSHLHPPVSLSHRPAPGSKCPTVDSGRSVGCGQIEALNLLTLPVGFFLLTLPSAVSRSSGSWGILEDDGERFGGGREATRGKKPLRRKDPVRQELGKEARERPARRRRGEEQCGEKA